MALVVRAGAWLLALVVLLALEGAFWAQLPLSFLHVLLMPALYAGRWAGPALVGIALAEWGLGRIPLGAGLSTVAVVGFAAWLLHDDVNSESPWLALVVLPCADLLRRFWSTLFAQLYDLPSTPSISWAELVVEAVLGVVVMQVLLWHRARARAKAGLTLW